MSEENTTPDVAVAASETAAPVETKAEVAAPAKAEPVAEEKEAVEIPKEFKALVDQVEKMTVLELHALVKVLEKHFGVSAQAVAVAGPAAAAGGAEEQSEFTVELTETGAQKIAVIKVIKEVLGLGLKEAKDLVDAAPSVVKENMKKEDADALKAKLEEAGAKITLK